MLQRLTICLVTVSLAVAMPRPAFANTTDRFDTLDSAEIDDSINNDNNSNVGLIIRGILVGGTATVTRIYIFGSQSDSVVVARVQHCHRLSVLALSRPGKYEFAIGGNTNNGTTFPSNSGCRLTLRTL